MQKSKEFSKSIPKFKFQRVSQNSKSFPIIFQFKFSKSISKFKFSKSIPKFKFSKSIPKLKKKLKVEQNQRIFQEFPKI